MTTMTRFVPLRTPFEDVAGLQKRLNSIFNDFAGADSLECQLCAGGGRL